ncbi:AAA family ATPase [Limnoglobus roseus]|uniref:MoxR family ATPase n=1 Tax=Limnoglobus roseus TaxID=2598579 RepID=A0A5C1APP6_9BACT|nr:MoxR family ATPase [Limnoglobus roseus]
MAQPGSPAPVEAQLIKDLAATYERMSEQIGKVIVGQKTVVEQLLMAMFSRGHCLLVGVPGLAKTLLVSTVAKILHLSFKRVQFTPDLMPADITGTDILQDDPETGRRRFVFLPGPLFANMILADEINRTPPKTQAALLEAMQEHHVTAGGTTYRLPEPFFVLATQNPIEQEGTYPLPEAQQDRFMFNIRVDYPSRAEEIQIMKATTGTHKPELTAMLDAKQIMQFQQVVRQVVVADHIFAYVADLVRSTRPKEKDAPKWVPELVSWGAGPRACQFLILGGKTRAILYGRVHVTTDDIKAVALPVLRHRIMTTFHADADGITTDDIIKKLIEATPVPLEKGRL